MQRQTWEYRTIKLDAAGWLDRQVNFGLLDEKLNDTGAEGWELVSVVHVVGGTVNAVVAFLKRPSAGVFVSGPSRGESRRAGSV